MPEKRHTGRARVNRPHQGRARVGRSVGKAPLPEQGHTSVLPAVTPETPPVFVDASGSRRRRVRRIAYVVGLLLVAVLVAIWLSQLGGLATPPERTPCPAPSAGACVR